MKKLLLMTVKKTIASLYEQELRTLFDGYLEICSYASADSEACERPAFDHYDIILQTNPSTIPAVHAGIRSNASIITLNFTFARENIERLKLLPKGTDALICFNYYGPAYQTTYILYELGLTNLNLFIDYPNNPQLVGREIRTAIVSNQTDIIPAGIDTVINLGDRKLSFTTIMEIAMCANVLDTDLEQRIDRYSKALAAPDNFVSSIYDLSSAMKMQLQSIINCIDYAIIIMDQSCRIINFNQNFLRFFHLEEDIHYKHLSELKINPSILRVLSEYPFTRDTVLEFRSLGKHVMFSKLRTATHEIHIILLKDVTDIINADALARKQLAKKGYLAKYHFNDIKGNSPVFCGCIQKAKKIASLDKPVLLLGESGTGKELFAQSIHNESPRSKFPFIAINCASLPTDLLESELFGYEDGAFTGAKKGGKLGLFQLAHKGTLFLDEIGELPRSTQAKLLRALEEKEIMRVGGDEIIQVDVRIIAATNRDLNALSKTSEFRLDLYYRLNTLTLQIPPLRQRREDIPLLIEYVIEKNKLPHKSFRPEVSAFFQLYHWNGNVRELRNCIDYMLSICPGESLSFDDLPEYMQCESLADSENQGRRSIVSPEMREQGDLLLPLLELLKERPIGREAMIRRLAARGVRCSEYRLRTLLRELQSSQYLIVGRGRAGTMLSPLGKIFLRQLKTLDTSEKTGL